MSIIERARALVAGATPGPWTEHRDDGGYPTGEVHSDAGTIADCDSEVGALQQCMNAIFIASAPTLIAELADAVEAAEFAVCAACWDACVKRDEAIARAEAAEAALASDAAWMQNNRERLDASDNEISRLMALLHAKDHQVAEAEISVRSMREYVRAVECVEADARLQVVEWRGRAVDGFKSLRARLAAAESRAAQAEAVVQELIAALPTEDEHDAIRECTSESEYSPRVHESLGQGRDERRKVWDYLSRYALAARKARK